jgi:drug/metabolite transporter (DMT)-like permease
MQTIRNNHLSADAKDIVVLNNKIILSAGNIRLGQGELWALTAAFAYALDNVLVSSAVRGHDVNNILGVIVRQSPGLIFALFMCLSLRKRNPSAVSVFSNWRFIAALAAYGVLTFVIANPMLFAAFQAGGVLVVTPLTSTQALWGAIIAVIVLREPLNRKMVLGMIVSIIGVTLLSYGRAGAADLAANWWIAIPMALGTAFCWSLSGVLITYTMRHGVDRFQALAVALIIGLGLLTTYLLVSGNISLFVSTPIEITFKLLFAGLFSMLAIVGVASALSHTTVASASTLSSLQSGIAPLIACLFFGEQITFLSGLGVVIILAGVITVQQARLK